ncbi:10149_t:CDS:2, partial [Cetraspora pellucida]
VEITYINDTKTCCFFQEIGDTSNFHKNLTSQLDSIININDINNAPNENNDILNVKYEELYSFSCKEIVQMDDANKNSK